MTRHEVRVGKVSAIDYERGMIQVVYHDKDDEVTRHIPLLSHEYMMPPVGALVAVAHLTNGSEAGVVFWRPWSDKNVPPEGYEGLYRKDFDLEPWKCYIRYDANIPESLYHTEGDDYVEIVGKQETLVKKDRKDTTEGNNEEHVTGNRTVTIQGNAGVTVKGKLTLKVGSCTVTIDGGTVTVDAASKLAMTAPNITIDGNTVNITGVSGDCVISGVSLVHHVHTCPAAGAPTSPPLG